LESFGHDQRLAFSPVMADQVTAAREGAKLIERYKAEEGALSAPYAPEAARRVPLEQMRAAWTKAKGDFWPLGVFTRRKAAQALAQSGGAASKVNPEADLPRLESMRDLLAQFDALASRAAGVHGWSGLGTDPTAIEATIGRAERLRTAIAAEADGP